MDRKEWQGLLHLERGAPEEAGRALEPKQLRASYCLFGQKSLAGPSGSGWGERPYRSCRIATWAWAWIRGTVGQEPELHCPSGDKWLMGACGQPHSCGGMITRALGAVPLLRPQRVGRGLTAPGWGGELAPPWATLAMLGCCSAARCPCCWLAPEAGPVCGS